MPTSTPSAQNVPPRDDLSPDDERGGEVDLRRGWRAVLDLWWVVLLVTVAAVALAALDVAESPDRYQGTATVYVGKPLAPNGQPLNTVTADATTAIELATSDEAVAKAAEAADTTPAAVRAGLQVQPVQSPIASKLQNPPTLLKVIVRSGERRVADAATTAITSHLVDETNDYSNRKIEALEQRIETLRQSDREQQRERERAERALSAGATGVEAAVWSTLLSTMALTQRSSLIEIADAQEELVIAREIEVSRVVNEPTTTQLPGKETRSSLVVALFLGLALGIAAALLLSWLVPGLRRVRRTRATAPDKG